MELRARNKRNFQTEPDDDYFTKRMRSLNERDFANIQNQLVKPISINLTKLPKDLPQTVNLSSSNAQASNNFVPFVFEDHNEGFPELARATLKEIYYNPRHEAGFSSPRKLYLAARKEVPYISQQQVRRWLASQRTYGLTKSVNKNFRRRKVIVRGLFHQYQADLLDMARKSKTQKKKRKLVDPGKKVESDAEEEEEEQKDKSDFILTVIDCFSRFAHAVPVKSKRGIDVAEGFLDVFSHMKPPKKMQTDDGVEFYNQHVRKLFRHLNIIHFSTDQELKAQIVERFNRTLREKINRYRTANNTMLYHDVLPDLIHAYNSSPHSSLGNYAPAEVTPQNEQMIREIQYGPYLRSEAPDPKFKIGEIVRAARVKKGLKKVSNTFKRELFVITDVIYTNPPTYRLKSRETGDIVAGSYYEPQLQKVLLRS